MNVSARAARRALSSTRPLRTDTICLSCQIQLRQQKRAASTATATAEAPKPSRTRTAKAESAPPAPKQTYRIVASVIVSRAPLLTRESHPFERAYHLYNRRLNERLALPFTRYFYYKKGTPADAEWKRKVAARQTIARDIGSYNAYAEDAWNDEALVGDKTAEWDSVVGEVYRDAEEFTEDAIKGKGLAKPGTEIGLSAVEEARGQGEHGADASKIEPTTPAQVEAEDAAKLEGATTAQATATSEAAERKIQAQAAEAEPPQEPEDDNPFQLFGVADDAQDVGGIGTVSKEAIPRPAPRVTEADKTNNVQSLSRKLDRTLYLVVKNAQGHWKFPSAALEGREALSQAAERVLIQAGGLNLNTWVVGHAPVAWAQQDLAQPELNKEHNSTRLGDKTFFLKARAMTGQLDIGKNVLGDEEFRWLAREELQGLLHPAYFSAVRNVLVER